MKASNLYKSRFLNAEDLGNRTVEVEIVEAQEEEIGDKSALVLYFKGKEKQLVLNKTNALALIELLGDDTDNWPGKTIKLKTEGVQFQGKRVRAVRVVMPEGSSSDDSDELEPAF